MAFEAHGFVDEEAEAFGKAVVALLSQELQDVVQEIRIGVTTEGLSHDHLSFSRNESQPGSVAPGVSPAGSPNSCPPDAGAPRRSLAGGSVNGLRTSASSLRRLRRL
jgi:hypothetical protein